MLQHNNPEPRNPSRVVILGGSGFVGRALTAELERLGAASLALSSQDLNLLAAGAGAKLAGLLQPGDAVVVLAALTPDKGKGSGTLMQNLAMAQNVLQGLAQAQPAQVIYFSSDAVYSFDEALIKDQTPAGPIDLYGAMHRTRELMFLAEVKAPLAILRSTLVYGAGDSHNSYGPNRFRRMAREQGKITLFGQGEETRDHILVEDLAALVGQVLTHCSSGTLNAATGRSASFREVAQLVADQFGGAVSVEGAPRANPITYRAFDPIALQMAFPTFCFTPLEEGIARVHQQTAQGE